MKNPCFSAADILLPDSSADISLWPVVACDQFTSEKNYWEKADALVGDKPSTLRMILPECYLEDEGLKERVEEIDSTMISYLNSGVFREYLDSYILVERKTETGTRLGLVGKLDLEEYDYSPDSLSLIRATEGTILSRIPPRKEIRKNAPLELPHIVVLISDAERQVIEPIYKFRDSLEKVYDTDLMLGGGHVTGYLISRKEEKNKIERALLSLSSRLRPSNPLLFAMGDGNHSLATAKSLWEDLKPSLTEAERESHPARYALVEIENIFDEGLEFEPIHRIFFSLSKEKFDATLSDFAAKITSCRISRDEIQKRVNEREGQFALSDGESIWLYTLEGTEKKLSAWTVQSVIDTLLNQKVCTVDYIHGMDTTLSLAKDGNLALILPDIPKETFFQSILSDKAFPRKTFSIGHAEEKRYYIEARRIRR